MTSDMEDTLRFKQAQSIYLFIIICKARCNKLRLGCLVCKLCPSSNSNAGAILRRVKGTQIIMEMFYRAREATPAEQLADGTLRSIIRITNRHGTYYI